MPSEAEVHITGLRELNRAMARTTVDLRRDFKKTLKAVAEPVRDRAQALARENISHIGDRWSGMRIGATQSVVYVAPKQRGGKGGPKSRPNLAALLMDRAMQPALDESAEAIETAVGVMFDTLAIEWER